MSERDLDPIRSVFDGIDATNAAFQAATGLKCPEGCGRCCLSPNVETTVLEVLPMAYELARRGEAEPWLARAREARGRSVCVFYEGSARDPSQGRCGIYEFRPSICRLFGFAAVRDKDGSAELAACAVHKDVDLAAVERARAAIAAGTEVAVFGDAARHFSALDPNLGTMRLPINDAVSVALDRVLFESSLRAREV